MTVSTLYPRNKDLVNFGCIKAKINLANTVFKFLHNYVQPTQVGT